MKWVIFLVVLGTTHFFVANKEWGYCSNGIGIQSATISLHPTSIKGAPFAKLAMGVHRGGTD